MSNMTEYKDKIAIHPGYYVAEIIDDMGISQAEFATRMGTTAKTISKLINGRANISNDLAKKLSVMLGTGVEVWQNLQNTYDQMLIEIQKDIDIENQEHIVKDMDYNYWVQLGELPSVRGNRNKISCLCEYFHISNLNILMDRDFLVSFRSVLKNTNEKNMINSRAWIQTSINISNSIVAEPFSAEKLRYYLPELRSMTVKTPEVFIPRMRDIFSECGVVFVLLPHLKNSGVNGAVKWINDERVLLAMNNRGRDADVFWFSLFHEIRHVLQQKVKTVFISSSISDMMVIDKEWEEDADKFAADYLIRPSDYKKLIHSENISDEKIVDFADSIGIHPGIVVGRLQHDGIIPYNRGSKLKVKYDWTSISSSAS